MSERTIDIATVETLIEHINPMIGGSLKDAACLVSDALKYLASISDDEDFIDPHVNCGRRLLLDCCCSALRYHLDKNEKLSGQCQEPEEVQS